MNKERIRKVWSILGKLFVPAFQGFILAGAVIGIALMFVGAKTFVGANAEVPYHLTVEEVYTIFGNSALVVGGLVLAVICIFAFVPSKYMNKVDRLKEIRKMERDVL